MDLLKQKGDIIHAINREIYENNREREELIVKEGRAEKKEAPGEAAVQENEDRNSFFERIKGKWEVADHSIKGRKYLDHFVETKLKGQNINNVQVEETYDFKDRICVKTMNVSGNVRQESGEIPFQYRVRAISSYDISDHSTLAVKLESGYLFQKFNNNYSMVREFDSDDNRQNIQYHFDGDELVLDDMVMEDVKRLGKVG